MHAMENWGSMGVCYKRRKELLQVWFIYLLGPFKVDYIFTSYLAPYILEMVEARWATFTCHTFKKQFLSHCLGFDFVQVNHSHLRSGLSQGVSKRSAYALPSTRHVGHLSIKTHPV